MPSPFQTPATARRLDGILAHIDAHLGDPLPLQSLAAMVGLSVWRFATVFRETVGVSPHRYICTQRVRQAQTLLRQGLPLASVATAVGFCDQSHLSRRFKHLCSVTPGQYQCEYQRTQSA